ncbi:hypothetical protein [Rhizobium sp. RU33A]|uniref:hypothetical protein n=1 Tax=Rhizobium sp. RU33A TaxID=1907413 RepID=UPI0009714302|nr:hypothetical protein [Rhizobium sp. RU33A]
MSDDRLPLEKLAAKSGNPDFLQMTAESVLQMIMLLAPTALRTGDRMAPDRLSVSVVFERQCASAGLASRRRRCLALDRHFL